MSAGLCGCSCAPVFLHLIQLANPLLKYSNVRGPPDLRAVAHRLTTSVLEKAQQGPNRNAAIIERVLECKQTLSVGITPGAES